MSERKEGGREREREREKEREREREEGTQVGDGPCLERSHPRRPRSLTMNGVGRQYLLLLRSWDSALVEGTLVVW